MQSGFFLGPDGVRLHLSTLAVVTLYAGFERMYLGPDVTMPLASALAAIVGVLLMFGRRVAGGLRAMGHRISRLFGGR